MTARPPAGLLRHRGFAALLGAEFCGAVNDNLYKMAISLLAIGTAATGGSGYLSLTGIAVILPYLLFAGHAGRLADSFSKRSVLVGLKALEILLMMLAVAALVAGRADLMLAVLFLTATQSALSSPAKFGILPELLPSSALSQANGLLQCSRYAAIILGTVAAGALLTAWPGQPAVPGVVLVAVAIAGWLASRQIPAVRPASSAAATAAWRDLAAAIRRIAVDRILAPVVLATTWFDFLSTLAMLDLLLLAKQVAGLDDLRTGMLAAAAGIGIGAGSIAAGWLSGGRIRPALTAPGAIGVGSTLLLAPFWGHSFGDAATALGLMGFASGFLLVPLNALLQHRPRRDEKGRIIAANNFLNMAGVLSGSIGLWLLHDLAGLSPQMILSLAGLATLFLAAVLLTRLRSSLFGCRPAVAPNGQQVHQDRGYR